MSLPAYSNFRPLNPDPSVMGAANTSQDAYNQYASSVFPGPGQSVPSYQDWVQQQQATPDPQNNLPPNPYGNNPTPLGGGLNGGLNGGLTNTNAGGTDAVSGLYQSLLGRAPDAAGLQYWNQQLASGKSINDIANAFKATPEYQQRQQQPQVQPNPSTQPNTNPYGITTANPYASSTNPYIQAAQQTSLANLAGAQTATAANRVNQQTPYANLNYVQTGTDAQGNPIWTAKQSLAGPLQGALSSLQQNVANQAGRGFNPQTPSVGINPGETYSDAIMRRLQPQQEQAAQRLETQLANQGIMPGSEAYNRAKTQLAQAQNDQLTSAVVGGFNTGLQANQQSFNQQLQQANLPFTQLGAFQQATQPGYVNPYTQAATAGPDYLGAYTTANAADIAARNAQMAQKNNITSGLFQLGTAGLLGSGGLGGLLSLGKGAYDWLNPAQYTSTTDYLQTAAINPGTFTGDAFTMPTFP